MREMRESGLPGIGKIPYGFEVSRIKFIADIFGRIGFRGYTEQDLVDEGEGAIALSPSNLKNMKMTYDRCSYISWNKYRESPEIMIHDYDILMVKTGSTYGKSCLVENLPIEATINPQLLVYKNLKIDAKFFSYFLQTNYVSDLCELAVVGSTIPTMSQSKVGNFAIIVPPKDVQIRISKHLDCCCAEIDALAANIQSQIDMLEQYKRSVITEAVTKGLNPDAEMRNSGIPWIGNVPANWKVENPKYHFVQRQERATKEMVQLTASQKYGVVTQTEYMELTGARIVVVQKDFDILKKVCAGDFIIHMRSFQGGLEYSTKSGSISSAYVMLIPQKSIAEPRYYRWFFKSPVYIDALSSTSNLVRDGQAMRWANFIQLPIPIPPADEQVGIADFLDAKCAEIDGIIADKKTQLETLDEYKKSLIFEYVTGKKEVSATLD